MRGVAHLFSARTETTRPSRRLPYLLAISTGVAGMLKLALMALSGENLVYPYI